VPTLSRRGARSLRLLEPSDDVAQGRSDAEDAAGTIAERQDGELDREAPAVAVHGRHGQHLAGAITCPACPCRFGKAAIDGIGRLAGHAEPCRESLLPRKEIGLRLGNTGARKERVARRLKTMIHR